MPDLSFQVNEARADVNAASPMLQFRLRMGNADPHESIQNVALRCQIWIEATRRRYSTGEQARLVDLFGEADRWSSTLGKLLWTHVNVTAPPFAGSTQFDLPVPCTFDFNVAATKYFGGLESGDVPILFQFSGTIFYASGTGALQVAQISWDKEARYRLPSQVWREMMEVHYPNGAWLRLRRDVFDRLQEYKAQRGIPTWEAAFESLLAGCEQRATL